MSRLALVLAAPLALSSCAMFRPRPPEYEPVVHPSGLVTHDLVVPEDGPVAAVGDRVRLHYTGSIAGGEVFDSSLERGAPIEFVLGEGEVPAGLEQGIEGMRRLGRRRIVVPPELGYGDEGVPGAVPTGATLVFEIELLDLQPAEP